MTQQQNDPYTTIRNLSSACGELEHQNNLMRTRCAELAALRDRALDTVETQKTEIEKLNKQIKDLTPPPPEANA